jgi:hypothetical protein
MGGWKMHTFLSQSLKGRLIGRIRRRWEDKIKDLKQTGHEGMDWIQLA